MEFTIQKTVDKYKKDITRLMDILVDIQDEIGYISKEAIGKISKEFGISKVDVEQTISFYHFFSTKPIGKYAVYLNNSAVACMMGRNEIAETFEQEVGCTFGNVSKDGLIGLYDTACIGMNDQEPAAIINGVVFTKLTTDKVKEIVRGFKAGKAVREFVTSFGDKTNNSEYLKTMVNNNIIRNGSVLFAEYKQGDAIIKLVSMSPEQLIAEIKNSNLRGRGGAGFSTGMKWDFCSKTKSENKYIICNADEGEPGTFKDRVLLTELPHMIFEGMIIGGYAIGSKQGILYLRSEYRYLITHLEHILSDMRRNNLLGKDIANKRGFDFDIRIQIGAGAYICGEESALIESAEGKRGEPRNRPPFPVTKGYLQQPTAVNNVETLCSVVRIVEKGSQWYKSIGTKDSSGTKLLSISGDCKNPGVYEIEWGMTINEMLKMCGAENVQAVQVAGPSGLCINPSQFQRKIAYEDLPTGGSMIIINKNRNLLKDLVLNFTEFFVDESCGSCVPCRSLTCILKEKLKKIIDGKGKKQDLDEMVKLGKMMKELNRCGLGQTAANPILTTIENFREQYETLIKDSNPDFYEFDMQSAIAESCSYVGRKVNI
ncbi:MAG: NAD(P)H-dependent oxidoreductase subunit E [Bacteroidota bacterium]